MFYFPTGCIIRICIAECRTPCIRSPERRDRNSDSAVFIESLLRLGRTDPSASSTIPINIPRRHILTPLLVEGIFIAVIAFPGTPAPVKPLFEDFVVCFIILIFNPIRRHPIIILPRYIVSLINFFISCRINRRILQNTNPNRVRITLPRSIQRLTNPSLSYIAYIFTGHRGHYPRRTTPMCIMHHNLRTGSIISFCRAVGIDPHRSIVGIGFDGIVLTIGVVMPIATSSTYPIICLRRPCISILLSSFRAFIHRSITSIVYPICSFRRPYLINNFDWVFAVIVSG